ncbi:carboxymuconolactone decarboxylase family protein [uncultured Roseobacter sp.]|uniref:carboxymuconolactone decarboxylase family protein n=1 Tax=uncultured Roseobacter sp. TaxID=114847 RepID=UPI0026018E26|nr:peroxidase-related enzyme [uncultured Roseobacter sp.]
MTWITTVPFEKATGKLRMLYERIAGPGNNVDNIMMAHSLRPHTMEGHMAIYKHVLHHSGNTLPKWFLEVLGVWVSHLNSCAYCEDHHFAGMKRVLGDDDRADAIRECIATDDMRTIPLDPAQQVAMHYARKLTRTPAMLIEADVQELRAAGFDDGQILEVNQVVSYFSYANRTVLGLGCSTKGDIIGLSPGNADDPDDWGHR